MIQQLLDKELPKVLNQPLSSHGQQWNVAVTVIENLRNKLLRNPGVDPKFKQLFFGVLYQMIKDDWEATKGWGTLCNEWNRFLKEYGYYFDNASIRIRKADNNGPLLPAERGVLPKFLESQEDCKRYIDALNLEEIEI